MSIATGTVNKGDTVRCPGGTAQGQPRQDLGDQSGTVVDIKASVLPDERKVEVLWPRGRVYYDGQICYDKARKPMVAPERGWHRADEVEVTE